MDWHTIANKIATLYQKTQVEIVTLIEWVGEQTLKKSKDASKLKKHLYPCT